MPLTLRATLTLRVVFAALTLVNTATAEYATVSRARHLAAVVDPLFNVLAVAAAIAPAVRTAAVNEMALTVIFRVVASLADLLLTAAARDRNIAPAAAIL